MKKFLALTALPLALLAGMSATASAAPNRDATLTVSTAGDGARLASDAAVGSSLVFSGCGYTPGVGVSLKLESPSAIAFFGGVAGSDGCFSTADTQHYVAQDAGNYKASSYQANKRKADATVTFTIAP